MSDTANENNLIGREVSWVEFNARVLDAGLKPYNPLLERLKFLAIVSSNFDEFFMVRLAGLARMHREGVRTRCPAGLTPNQQLTWCAQRTAEIVEAQYVAYRQIRDQLAARGLLLARQSDYTDEQRRFIENIFEEEIFPVLTPLAAGEDDFPFAANGRLHVAFLIQPNSGDDKGSRKLAIVPIPAICGRLRSIPAEAETACMTYVEDMVGACGERMFPGHSVLESTVFRVTRDADLSVDEERDWGFVDAMAAVVLERDRGVPVRLEIAAGSARLKKLLVNAVGLKRHQIFEIDGPLDLTCCFAVAGLPGFEALQNPDWLPQQPRDLPDAEEDLFDAIRSRDIMIHMPYESFDPVLQLIRQAAADEMVLAIKMTLYRTSQKSPIIRALETAAANGKQVTVLVELKARFNEAMNIAWARQLEQAGVIVVYGIAQLKVHAKSLLIVRREECGICRYVHLSTGNYNERTALLYTDVGLMSARDDLTYEVALFFNSITGYSAIHGLQKLIMAPHALRPRINQMIEREIQRTSAADPGLIMVKINSLVDPLVIAELYRASQAGVRILLNIRGICCLRPGVKELSETIRVVSIVGRYLEHSRIFYFRNGGNAEEVYLASADWMPRNIDRRVELMFPIEDSGLKQRLIDGLELTFSDTEDAWELQSDGSYRSLSTGDDGAVRSQSTFYGNAVRAAELAREDGQRRLKVRRKPRR
jgi:polyphosphate kinase